MSQPWLSPLFICSCCSVAFQRQFFAAGGFARAVRRQRQQRARRLRLWPFTPTPPLRKGYWLY